MPPETNRSANVDNIDFTTIFAILWRHRKLIIFGTLAVTLLAVALSFFIPRTYRSEGFYQLGNPAKKERNKEEKKEGNVEETDLIGLPIPLYKKSAPQFSNLDRFYLLVGERKSLNEKDMNGMKAKFRTAADINKWIMPVFTFAKEDAREFTQLSKDGSNSVLGLKLSYESDSPRKAYDCVQFFGYYIRNCFMYVTLYDYVKDEYSKAISELSRNENAIFDLQFKLQQNIKKMADIKTILTKYPQAAKMESRQVVSVQEGGFRFLGPVTQLVGIESALADQRRELADLQREKEKMAISREYFSQCNDALNKSSQNGEKIFEQLKAIKRDVFDKKNFRADTVKEVLNDLKIDLQAFDLAFYTNCRFISGPTFPARHIKPRKSVIVIIVFFLAAFFFVCLAFSLSWWQSHRQAILADSKKK